MRTMLLCSILGVFCLCSSGCILLFSTLMAIDNAKRQDISDSSKEGNNNECIKSDTRGGVLPVRGGSTDERYTAPDMRQVSGDGEVAEKSIKTE